MDLEDIVRRASAIEGWMSENELGWLARSASERRTIVEIGSWKGRSTKALAMATPGSVYAVDHWKGSETERGDFQKEAAERGADAIYAVFRSNLAEELAAGRCVPIRAESGEAATELMRLFEGREPKADMIFIDGEHTYEAVVRDLANFAPFVKPGTLISGHDYSPETPGVMRAVNAVLRGVRIAVDRIWWAVEP